MCLGIIPLRDCKVELVGCHPHFGENKFPNLIRLETTTRKYFLSNRDIQSARKWLEVLEESIALNNDGELSVK